MIGSEIKPPTRTVLPPSRRHHDGGQRDQELGRGETFHEANDLLWSLVSLIGAERTQTQIHCAHSVAIDLKGRR